MKSEIKNINLIEEKPVYELARENFNLCVYGKIFKKSSEEGFVENIENFLDSPESYIKGDFCFTLKTKDNLYLGCSRSSIVPIYFRRVDNRITYSLKLKDVIKSSTVNHLSEEAVYQFLTYEYIADPLTLVDNVYKVPSANFIKIGEDFSFELKEFKQQISSCIEDESSLSTFKGAIYKAHENRISHLDRNALLLSGGVDSCISAIVLKDILGAKNLDCFTFSTLNAEQDEFKDANNTAKYLGLNIERVIIDPNKIFDLEDLIYNSNFFYPGAIMISEIARQAGSSTNFFACQDTRLHTPALNPLDKFVFSASQKQRNYFSKIMNIIPENCINNELVKKVITRGRFSNDLERYIEELFFHKHDINLNSHAQDVNFSTSLKDCIENKFNSNYDWDARQIYNQIVNLAWHRQYSDDIQYLVSTASYCKSVCQMPWYDEELAFVSAQLPMSKATKFVTGRAGHSRKKKKVNKFILRNTFKGALPNEILFRDKAVCITNHLYLNGVYKPYIEKMRNSSILFSTHAGNALNIKKIFDIHYKSYSEYGVSDYSKVVEMQNIIALEIFCKVFKLS